MEYGEIYAEIFNILSQFKACEHTKQNKSSLIGHRLKYR